METEQEMYGFTKLTQVPDSLQPWCDQGMHLVLCPPTEFGSYVLVGCEPADKDFQHQVLVLDETGKQLPAIQIVVAWPDGNPIGKPAKSYWDHGETDLRGVAYWTDGNGYAAHTTGALGGERIWVWDIDKDGVLKLSSIKVENCPVLARSTQYHNLGIRLTFQRRTLSQPSGGDTDAFLSLRQQIQLKQQEIANLKQQIQAMERTLLNMQARLEDLQQQAVEAQQAGDQARLRVLLQQIQHQQAEIAHQEAELQDAQARLADLQNQLQELLDLWNKIQELLKRIADLKQKIAADQHELQESEQQIQFLQLKIQELQAAIAKEKADLTAAEAELAGLEKES